MSKGLVRNKIYSLGGNNNKCKVIEHLINLNKYQSIPSIPSNLHAFGYNDALELNEPPVELFKGEKGDTVGPGQYESQKDETSKSRGVSWVKEKAIKDVNEDEKDNIGPGSYEVKTM